MGKLENLKKIADSILERTNGLSSNSDLTLNFLEEELAIIKNWHYEVDSVKESIDLIPLDEVPILKDVFDIVIDDLETTAQRFLDRPEDVF